MPVLRAGQNVTFGHRKVTGADEYGNDVYNDVEKVVPGCAVSPGNSSENWDGTVQIESDVTVHAPFGTEIDLPLDYMLIDDYKYNVVGKPSNWTSPFTGTISMLEIRGRLVTTGGAAT
jgi:hypothetical protein